MPTDKELAQIHAKQRARARDIAERMQRGEKIDKADSAFAARALLAFSAQAFEPTPRKRGRQPTLNAEAVALEFYELVELRGMSRNRARGLLAEKHGVTPETIRTAATKHARKVLAFLRLGR